MSGATVVYLDVGHGDKGERSKLGAPIVDPGACFGGLTERDVATAYAHQAREVLLEAGVEVVTVGDGPYTTRHARVCADHERRGRPSAAYLQCHVNAGLAAAGKAGKQRGEVLHDARSQAGAALARCVADAVAGRLHTAAARGLASGDRGHVCIAGIWRGAATLTGVVVEPYFIDGPRGLDLAHDPVTVGGVIAAGVLTYLRGVHG